MTSRRRFLQNSIFGLAAAAFGSKARLAYSATRPNSIFNGVQVGTITYSYRSMPDQSAEGLLGYIVESGVSAVELMGNPAEVFAGRPRDPQPEYEGLVRRQALGQLSQDEEQSLQEIQPRQAEYLAQLARWRAAAPMDAFRALRQMYEAAGVKIYAWKPSVFSTKNSDAEIEYGFRAARALGATHCTTELPVDAAQTLRLGTLAERNGVYIAYHTHAQGSMTAFDTAFAQSSFNASNVDLGHYVAAPKGGDPLPFLRSFHDRIASVHLKDRQTFENGAGNLEWGRGDTPLVEILRLMRDEQYAFLATVELEYPIPEGSSAVREVARCVEFCRRALEA